VQVTDEVARLEKAGRPIDTALHEVQRNTRGNGAEGARHTEATAGHEIR